MIHRLRGRVIDHASPSHCLAFLLDAFFSLGRFPKSHSDRRLPLGDNDKVNTIAAARCSCVGRRLSHRTCGPTYEAPGFRHILSLPPRAGFAWRKTHDAWRSTPLPSALCAWRFASLYAASRLLPAASLSLKAACCQLPPARCPFWRSSLRDCRSLAAHGSPLARHSAPGYPVRQGPVVGGQRGIGQGGRTGEHGGEARPGDAGPGRAGVAAKHHGGGTSDNGRSRHRRGERHFRRSFGVAKSQVPPPGRTQVRGRLPAVDARCCLLPPLIERVLPSPLRLLA